MWMQSRPLLYVFNHVFSHKIHQPLIASFKNVKGNIVYNRSFQLKEVIGLTSITKRKFDMIM